MNYETIEQYASLPFNQAQVEVLCELDPGAIDNDTQALAAYQRGQLKARATIYSALMTEARERGSVPAARELAAAFDKTTQGENHANIFDEPE